MRWALLITTLAYCVALSIAMLALTFFKEGLWLGDAGSAVTYLLVIGWNLLPVIVACVVGLRSNRAETSVIALISIIALASVSATFTYVMFLPTTETDVAMIYLLLPAFGMAVVALFCVAGFVGRAISKNIR